MGASLKQRCPMLQDADFSYTNCVLARRLDGGAIHGNCSRTRRGLVAEILYKNRFPIRPIMRYIKANQWFE
jgi:hypothetical protein